MVRCRKTDQKSQSLARIGARNQDFRSVRRGINRCNDGHQPEATVLPSLTAAASQRGFAPRPAQVSPAGLRYFGGIFLPLISNCSSMSARRLRSSSSTCFRKLMSDVKSFAIDLTLPWLPPKNVLRYSQANASRTPMPIAIPETHPGRAWPSRYASGEQSVQSVWE